MVIMKMLFNNKGISLVILIFAMTFLGLLGAGMVSFMGAKQKSYPFQVNSYKALNIANAGVEYAIRFAYEQTFDANSDFFKTSQFSIGPLNFGGGTFQIAYTYDQAIANDKIVVDATYQGVTRQIRLYKFRYYAFNGLARVPGDIPRISTMQPDTVEVPVINNNENSINNFTIKLTINFSEVPSAKRKVTISCYGQIASEGDVEIVSGIEYTFTFNTSVPANSKGVCLLDFTAGDEKRKKGGYTLKLTDKDVIKFLIQ
jgi:hypothetical protein